MASGSPNDTSAMVFASANADASTSANRDMLVSSDQNQTAVTAVAAMSSNSTLESDWYGSCQRCQDYAQGMIGGGAFVGCAVRCGRYRFGEGRLWCMALCNLFLNGGC